MKNSRSKTSKSKKIVGDMSRGGAYNRYKRTTRAFQDGLAKLVPFRLVSVSDLAKAVGFISSNCRKPIDYKSLLDNLDETIALREIVGATYSEEINDGHLYIIQTLQYCRQVLQGLWKRKQRATKTMKTLKKTHTLSHKTDEIKNDKNVPPNGFQILCPYEEEESNSDIPGFERPSEPVSKVYSIEEDLIKGSMIFQANLFFLAAENLFATVVETFETLKEQLKDSNNHQTVIQLIQASAAVNLALENVQYLERSFLLECEHFHSIHHIFAVLIFQKQIYAMEDIMGPEIFAKNPESCYSFVSFCIKFGFIGARFYLSPCFDNCFDDRFIRHIKGKPKLSNEQLLPLKEIALRICATADLESHFDPEDFGHERTLLGICYVNPVDGSTIKSTQTTTNQWLKNYSLLGGTKSSIMHTFSLVDNRCNGEDVSRDEEGQEMSFYQILKTIWCQEVDPLLFHFCNNGREEDIMYCDKLLPFLGIYKEKMPKIKKDGHHMTITSTDFATVFAVHSLVYGIYALQNERKRIAVLSRLTFHKFMAQIEDLPMIASETSFQQNKIMQVYRALSFRSKDAVAAFWNPLFSGCALSVVAFSCNMGRGYCASGIGGLKTRIVLHLYNGLRKRNMICNLDLLEKMHMIFFKSSEADWPTGVIPDKEGFLKSFCLAMGDRSRVVNQYIDFLKKDQAPLQSPVLGPYIDHLPLSKQAALQRVYWMYKLREKHQTVGFFGKLLGPILLSPSFNHLVGGGKPQCARNTADLGASCSREAALLKSKIEKDSEILRLNWFKVCHDMEEFLDKVLGSLEISSLVKDYCNRKMDQPVGELYEIDVTVKFLADMVFRELEFEKDGGENSKIVATLMSEYFTKIATLQNTTYF